MLISWRDRLMLQLSTSTGFAPSHLSSSHSAWDESSRDCCPNALSTQLLEHMLECDTCLTGSLDHQLVSCSIYRDLQEKIALCGGPSKSLILAY